MEKEFIGVSGFKAQLKDNEELFVKSSITKENLHLAHLEWLDLGNINFQGRGIFRIVTDEEVPFQIIFKRNQYDSMKELYSILLPYTKRISIDKDTKKITIFNKGNLDKTVRPMNKINVSPPYTYLSFDDINSYEVICDKQVINNDMLKNTASGKYVADGVGALVGALSSLNSGEYITNLQIKLNVNNFDNPCVYVNYITRKIKSDSQMAKDLIKMCDEDLAKLEIILKKDEPVESKVSNDPIEEVKKLKELLDMGILSQEEFDKKKKELLNL
ncbi:SHOCT domain-containing protein [Candidatus Stoquefichus massiliensis]|uniref:SHOCT domain-containing protein n=1 Tax=Candidatus Stoquefichus massiliensis TaxID=1470350 RepID=UPI00048901A6|nr:SHOCT domain-containing protein [Candidatus Stoquefichus massiliensis]